MSFWLRGKGKRDTNKLFPPLPIFPCSLTHNSSSGHMTQVTIKKAWLCPFCLFLLTVPGLPIAHRWKVENENNNTLKTKGYNLEHNFGHGKQHLSSLLATLNILSLLFHTLLEMLDQKYKLLRSYLPTRKTFFDDLRTLTRYLYFDSWDDLLCRYLHHSTLESDE